MAEPADPIRPATLLVDAPHRQEWLVTNGLGGYASPNPAGRVMMLNSLSVQLKLPEGADRSRVDVGWVPPTFSSGAALELVDFRLELGLPVWRYAGFGVVLEKRVVLSHGQNTTLIEYRVLEGPAVRIELRPALQFRGHDEPVSTAVPEAYPLTALGARIELQAPAPLPGLRLHLAGRGTSFVLEPLGVPDVQYSTEESRGYASRGQLFSPGRFRATLQTDQPVALLASTEPWDTLLTLSPQQLMAAELERRRRLIDAATAPARIGAAAELVLAADQFVIQPVGRHEDHVRARASGDQAWTTIAGYHWFTDWGRDTMISLEGLTLVTGRVEEAGAILRTFAYHVRDGLVPNMFPEGANEGLYHTADATLWFFHALDRYLRASGDRRTLIKLLPLLRDIIDHHLQGTHFGIRFDPDDGLLREGAPGFQLTWMDAKVGEWVVTPRRGKPVEINALWFNALNLMAEWLARTSDGQGAHHFAGMAELVASSFNRRFWNERTGCLFDVVDGENGDDDAIRPNQLFAISLPHAVLDPQRWRSVLDVCERELVTPLGLRSLSPKHPDFKPSYRGDLLARDAAYHQGTVWSWLIGPYIDAVLRVRRDVKAARAALEGLIAHLDDACIGSISEVFDAEPPYAPGGCIAQAWAVAELLRCLVITRR
jgi:predicted glycogen debranching enzyme